MVWDGSVKASTRDAMELQERADARTMGCETSQYEVGI